MSSRRSFLTGVGATGVVLTMPPVLRPALAGQLQDGADALERAFQAPPDTSRSWVYWWWLDGAVTKAGITADLEAMRQQGINGVLLFDAGFGGPLAPKGPRFMSDEWREYFRHAVAEAGRLKLEMSVNLCSGWNAGGPWLTRDDAIKHFVWEELTLEGPRDFDGELPRYKEKPPASTTQSMASTEAGGNNAVDDPTPWYRDIAVLACAEEGGGVWKPAEVQDLSARLEKDHLRWHVPRGRWTVLRLGFIVPQYDVAEGDDSIRTKARAFPDPQSWEIDPMSAAAMDKHYAHTAAKLAQDGGSLTGKTFRYVHIDSWEMGLPTWTAKLIEEFRQRRQYDPLPYLPALAGKTVESPDITARFIWDYRRTIADLIASNYYGRLSQLAHADGLATDSESGGPWYTHYVDALECLGTNDIPMGEFWSARGRFEGIESKPSIYGAPTGFLRPAESTSPASNFGSIKQAANAAHIYGKAICQAEAYTSFNPDWSEDPYYLKPYGDRAFCLGVTRGVLQTYTAQPSLSARPGYEWEHIGPHFDRNITWWPQSHAWFTYLTRCQYLLARGSFCADLLYFSGEAIPNFPLLDQKPIAGYDFDVINAQALLTRARARNGEIVLPDGMSYRYLIIPEGVAESVSPAVARKLKELVEDGATVIGAPPRHSLGLTDYPRSQNEVTTIVGELWGSTSAGGTKTVGAGRVISGTRVADVLRTDGVPPDLEPLNAPPDLHFDWIHRKDPERDTYFVANLTDLEARFEVAFRVSGKVPELWDAVSGAIRRLPEFRQENGRTVVPLQFAAKQSWFVVFRKAAATVTVRKGRNFPSLRQLQEFPGPWKVRFDARSGGPGDVVFQQLDDWTQRPEDSIRFYSGTAIYRHSFSAPRGTSSKIYVELGKVKNLAQVRVNGHDAGIVWTAPWRLEIGRFLRPGRNELEIAVTNLWPNRLIGDSDLPEGRRHTVTNVRTYDHRLPGDFSCWWDPECEARKASGAPAKLLPSGLLGPVALQVED